MTNIDAIIRALGKLGLEATGAPQAPKLVRESDSKKSLMILPFQDLSPTGDNGWFADGIVSELISALSHVKSLRLIDQKTSLDYKRYTGKTTDIARELGVRYFVEGSVRKFGDAIRVNVQLLDIEEGEYLWQYQHKGDMKDIFDIQEEVAKQVVEGLSITLTTEERTKIEERGTENQEAYECFLRSNELTFSDTYEARSRAIRLVETAIDLDPSFELAWADLARQSLTFYTSYDRDERWIQKAEHALTHVTSSHPDARNTAALLADIKGDDDTAERAFRDLIKDFPDYTTAYEQYGYFLFVRHRYEEARENYQTAITLGRTHHVAYWNLIVNTIYAGKENTKELLSDAVRVHKQWLRLHPEDVSNRARLAYLLQFIDASDIAVRHLEEIEALQSPGSTALLVVARARARRAEPELAVQSIRRAMNAGFNVWEVVSPHPDFSLIRDTPEFVTLLDELAAKQKAHG